MNLAQNVKLVDWDENRIGRFDLAKGVYLLGSISIHSWHGYITSAVQAPAHTKLATALNCCMRVAQMASGPLLMLICGYDYRKKSMKNTIRIPTQYLWRPYLFTTLAIVLAVFVQSLIAGVQPWSELCRKALPFLWGKTEWNDCFGAQMNNIGPMWFIVTFVTGCILLNPILKIKEERNQFIAVALLYMIGSSVSMTKYLRYAPFALVRALNNLPYLYLGYLMKKHGFFERRYPLWLLSGGVIVFLLSVYENRQDVLTCSLTGCILLVAAIWMDKLQFGFANWLRRLGRQITTFCCFNTFTYVVFPWKEIEARFAQKPWIGGLISISIYAIICFGGCFVVSRIKTGHLAKKRKKALAGNETA